MGRSYQASPYGVHAQAALYKGDPVEMVPDPELEAAAEEELAAATTLTWAALAKLVPWGDTYDGFGPAGGMLSFERGYIWKDAPGGDILCEVTAFRGPSRYDRGARRSRIIAKPGPKGSAPKGAGGRGAKPPR